MNSNIEKHDNVVKIMNGCYNIGDELIMSGLASILKKNGYYIELYIQRHPELFENNKNIDKLVIEKDKGQIGCLLCDVKKLNILLQNVGIEHIERIIPEMFLTDDEIEFGKKEIDKIKDKRKIVCFVPHSDSSPAYLSDGWDKIIFDNELTKEMQFIYIGHLKYENILNFNKFNLRQIASIINQCDMYIGINTGLYHIAKCFKLRGFIVNRPICEDHWGYFDDKHFDTGSNTEIVLNTIKQQYLQYLKI